MHPYFVEGVVGFVALIHVLILIVEMFFWMKPQVYQKFHFDEKGAERARPIVQNVGLYNGFLAAGLIWGAIPGEGTFPIRIFFLTCVLIAGLFGAVTIPRNNRSVPTTLWLQALPAAIALAVVWAASPMS